MHKNWTFTKSTSLWRKWGNYC